MLNTLKLAFNHLTGQAFNKPIFGEIASAVAPTLLGGLLGGGGSSGGTTSTMNPFNVSTGLFNTNFSNGNLNIGTNPILSNIQNALSQQALSQVGQTAPQAGLFSQLGTNFLSNMNAFDPMSIAQQQFDLMSPLLQDQQQKNFLNLENRQFQQGRLGSTGGAQELGQLNLANQFANQQLLADSLSQGMNMQGQAAQLGTNFAQAAPQLQGLYNNLPAPILNQLLGIDQAGLNAAQLGVQGAGQTIDTNQPSALNQIGTGLMTSGIEGISNSLGGLFGPTPQINPLEYLP